jgi:hypothetical protein
VQAPRDFAQHFVSDGVAVLVIDALEVIDVAPHHRGAASFPARSHDFVCHQLDNYATVPKRGQQVVRCLEPHALAGLHQVIFQFQDAMSSAQPNLRNGWKSPVQAGPFLLSSTNQKQTKKEEGEDALQ